MKHLFSAQSGWSRILLTLCLVLLQTFAVLPLLASAGDLNVGGYQLISQVRVGRTIFDYTYRATVENARTVAYTGVTATLVSGSPYTTVIDGSLTFGDVASGTTAKSSDTFTIRHDRLYEFRWSNVAWSVQFESALSNTISVGPEGGVLNFPNGVALHVPAGAVTQTTPITLTDLTGDAVNAILSGHYYASHTKRFLGGFTAEPTGLEFPVPIKAVVPVLPLTSGWIPAQIGVDLSNQAYAIVPGEIVYDGTKRVAEFAMRHLSGHAVVQITGADPTEAACRHCSSFEANKCAQFVSCSPGDACCVPEPACCTILQAERSNCYPQCKCCREELVRVTVAEADFTAGQCAIVSSEVSVEYPRCNPGCVTTESIREATPACSKVSNWTLSIEKPRDWIYKCQKAELRAVLAGTSADGTVQFSGVTVPVKWNITDGIGIFKDVREVGVNGLEVVGAHEGSAIIRAEATGLWATPPSRETVLGVHDLRLFVFPNEAILDVGDTEQFTANCEECPHPIAWTTDVPSVIGIIATSGDDATVVAKLPGTANLFARTTDYCAADTGNEINGEPATVTVSGQKYALTWDASFTTTNYRYVDDGRYTQETTTTRTGVWSGSAIIGYNDTVQSVTTSGNTAMKSISSTAFQCAGSPARRADTSEQLATIPAPGTGRLASFPLVIEVNNWRGHFILEPFHRDGGWNNTYVNANYTSDWHTVTTSEEPSCRSEGSGSNDTYEDFYFYFPNRLPMANILADSAGTTFSKEIVNAYSECFDLNDYIVGTECVSEDATYRVKVVKSR